MLTRPQIAAMPDDRLIAALAAIANALTKVSNVHRLRRAQRIAELNADAEAIRGEIAAREYLKQHGTFMPERMSPWAIEKREEVFGYRPRVGPRRTVYE